MQAPNRIQDDASIASRYLAGTLSDSELQSFEQYIIQNPDAVQELEATARAKVGLANLRDTGQLEALLREAPVATSSRRTAIIALAASLTFAVIGVGVWKSTSIRQSAALVASATGIIDRSGNPLAMGESYALLRTRASDYDAVVQLPTEPRAIELQVRPETTTPLYNVALSRIHPDGSVAQLAMVRELKRGGDGFLRLYVDSTRLEQGPYLLVVSAASADAGGVSASSFRLKVLGPGAPAR